MRCHPYHGHSSLLIKTSAGHLVSLEECDYQTHHPMQPYSTCTIIPQTSHPCSVLRQDSSFPQSRKQAKGKGREANGSRWGQKRVSLQSPLHLAKHMLIPQGGCSSDHNMHCQDILRSVQEARWRRPGETRGSTVGMRERGFREELLNNLQYNYAEEQ